MVGTTTRGRADRPASSCFERTIVPLSRHLPRARVHRAGACCLVRAQSREAFVEATVHFIQAAEGEFGDEGRYLVAALDEMGRSLAAWDDALVRTEAELATEAQASPPPAAARMRTALAAAYLERGRFAEALEQLERATGLAPALADAYLLKGLVFERMGRRRAGRGRLPRRLLARSGESRRGLPRGDGPGPLRRSIARPRRPRPTICSRPSPRQAGAGSCSRPMHGSMTRRRRTRFSRWRATHPRSRSLRQARYDDALTALRVAAASDPLVTAGSPDLAGAAGALRAGDAAGAIERTSDVLDQPSRLGAGASDPRARLSGERRFHTRARARCGRRFDSIPRTSGQAWGWPACSSKRDGSRRPDWRCARRSAGCRPRARRSGGWGSLPLAAATGRRPARHTTRPRRSGRSPAPARSTRHALACVRSRPTPPPRCWRIATV